jgi:hypothetical protein
MQRANERRHWPVYGKPFKLVQLVSLQAGCSGRRDIPRRPIT